MPPVRESNPYLGKKDDVIKDSMRLVHFVAKRYVKRLRSIGAEYEDLVSEGVIGLLKAFDRFDPTRFTKVSSFSTYAVPMIQGEMRRFIRDKGGLIRTPRSIQSLAHKISDHNLESTPPEEIARQTGSTVTQVGKALEYLHRRHVYRLDTPVKDDKDNFTFLDTIKADSDFSSVIVKDFIEGLPAKQGQVVNMLMGGNSQKKIGAALGVSQAQISRIVQQLRELITNPIYEREEMALPNNFTKETYLKMRAEGLSDTRIAERLKIGTNTLYRRKKSWGITTKPAAGPTQEAPKPVAVKHEEPEPADDSKEIAAYKKRIEQLELQVSLMAQLLKIYL